MTPKANNGLFCVCDPDGILVHTTVATSEKESIEQWMHIESGMNQLANMCRTLKGHPQKCMDSWEGFEAQGYKVVPVNLIPAHA